MSEVKWIKLNTNMFEDEKIKLIEHMPDADALLIIWIKLISQAGKVNASGYIFLNEKIPYSEEMLATIFNRPLNTVRLALKTFKQFGMIEIDDKSFIKITNWEKHQNVEGMERVKKLNAERNRRYRQRKKQEKLEDNSDVNVTSHDGTEEELEIEIEQEEDKEEELQQEQETEYESGSSSNLNAHAFYENTIGPLNPYIADDITNYCNDLSDELVIKAMQISLENQKQWRYAKGILNKWINQNIKTLNDVEAHETAFQNKQGNPTGNNHDQNNSRYKDAF